MKRARRFLADRKRIGSRILAVLLISVLIVESIAPVSAGAAEDEIKMSTKTIYKWERIKYDDIVGMANDTTWRVAFIPYDSDSDWLFDTGNCNINSFPIQCRSVNFTNYPGLSGIGDNLLYTAEDMKLVQMKKIGKDSQNGDRPIIRMQLEENNQWLSIKKYDENASRFKCRWRFAYTSNPRREGYFCSNMTVWQGGDSDRFKFQFNLPGKADEYLYCEGGEFFNHSDSDDYDFDSNSKTNFMMYKVTAETYSCVAQDYTVKSGQTLRLNGKVYIARGVTLTVEKDAVLLLAGVIMYDGSIANKGTTVLQKNGILQPLTPSTSLGDFTCSEGGDLLVMEGAKILCQQGFKLDSGSSCINFGIVFVPDNFYMNDSYFDNRSSGTLLLGYTVKPARFAGGSLNSSYGYSAAYESWGCETESMNGLLYLKLKKDNKIGCVNLLGESKLINRGVVNRSVRLNQADGNIYQTKDNGQELNKDRIIQEVERYLDNFYGSGKWHWNADGTVGYY